MNADYCIYTVKIVFEFWVWFVLIYIFFKSNIVGFLIILFNYIPLLNVIYTFLYVNDLKYHVVICTTATWHNTCGRFEKKLNIEINRKFIQKADSYKVISSKVLIFREGCQLSNGIGVEVSQLQITRWILRFSLIQIIHLYLK